MADGIRVTAVDLANGDTGERTIAPGDYCLVVAEPLYLVGEQRHANGTVVLTLKRRSQEPMMPDTLRRQIEQELDRREQIAHELVDAIGDSPWVVEYLRTTQRITNARALIIAETFVGSPLPGLSTKLAPEPEHIALHDPADALRRYAAARRVLARHRPILWESLTGERRCARCGDTLDCPEIADLAASLGLSTTTSEEQQP